MIPDDHALLTAIAATMRAEAGHNQPARRELPGGLIIRYHKVDHLRQLVLTSPRPGPTPAQRETWRAAFGVPGTAFEIKAPLESYITVSVEWEEVSQLLDSGKESVRQA